MNQYLFRLSGDMRTSIPKRYNLSTYNFVLSDLSKYNCVLCNRFLVDPIQLPCDHYIDSQCVLNILRQRNEFKYPKHCTNINKLNNLKSGEDICKEMANLEVFCALFGCKKIMPFHTLSNHERYCDCRLVDCPYVGCNIKPMRKMMEIHMFYCV